MNQFFLNFFNWTFGSIVFCIGIINSFWGNDPGFGVFLICLSFLYFPPSTKFIQKRSGRKIPAILKVGIGLFIVWAAVGVGELFDKIALMMKDF